MPYEGKEIDLPGGDLRVPPWIHTQCETCYWDFSSRQEHFKKDAVIELFIGGGYETESIGLCLAHAKELADKLQEVVQTLEGTT